MTAPMVDAQQRRRRGLALYREIMAVEPPDPATPRVAALIDFVFAEIWSRQGITRRDRRLIALACAAGDGAHTAVADHLYAALATGDLDVTELNEFVLHFAVYCGWPKAEELEEILADQVTRLDGVHGRKTSQPLPAPTDQQLRKRAGEKEFCAVNTGEALPPRGPYYDDGIVNFVYGEVWTRPGLSRRDRRVISLTLAGVANAVGPIQSHVYAALKSGDVEYAEMLEIVLHFAAHAGWPKGQYMQQSVDDMHARIAAE